MEANVVIDGVVYNYHVTKDGRVYSLNYHREGKTKELSYIIQEKGYRRVWLCKDGKGKYMRVSRLVALAYIPNPNNKPTVDHVNRDRADDRVENLRWATHSEQIINQKHPKNNKKSKAVMCVETGEIYPSANEIQRQLGFSQGNISACCNGKFKTAYGYHWQYINDCV